MDSPPGRRAGDRVIHRRHSHAGSGPEHHESTVGRDLLAEEDLVGAFGDSAYSTGEARQTLQEAGHRLFFNPRPAAGSRPRWFHPRRLRHRYPGRPRDLPRRTHRSPSDPADSTTQRKAASKDLCTGCPLRERCTRAMAGRILTIRLHHDLHSAARHQAATAPDWQADCRRWRPPV
ncbi:transposase [Streptomyces sp. 3213.3]|uniref:transposase n=1 Tax=Streptomyces sp. 3213.3 TaxID=1855348 RepID=UPI003FA69ABE